VTGVSIFAGFESGFFKIEGDRELHAATAENLQSNVGLWAENDLWKYVSRTKVRSELSAVLRAEGASEKLSDYMVTKWLTAGTQPAGGPAPLELLLAVARASAIGLSGNPR
jgi:hypothetical protein